MRITRPGEDVARALRAASFDAGEAIVPSSEEGTGARVRALLARNGGAFLYPSADGDVFRIERATIDRILADGFDRVLSYDQSDAPEWLARSMVRRLDAHRGMSVLEPSVGRGALLNELLVGPRLTGLRVTAVDLDRGMTERVAQWAPREVLRAETQDFLAWDPAESFHRVLMFPPRGKRALAHVMKAFGFLRRGGILCALVPDQVVEAARMQIGRAQTRVTMVGNVARWSLSGSVSERMSILWAKKVDRAHPAA